MEHLINKYLDKLQSQGLATKDDALFLALDAELFCNKQIEGDALELKKAFDQMNIGSLLFAEPAEPYKSIIQEIIRYDRDCRDQNMIIPMDCETRTFFHDMPVVDDFSAEAVVRALSLRKSAIIKGRGIVAYGAISPEQAYVSFSSTCFSTFVKYFYDSLIYLDSCAGRDESISDEYLRSYLEIIRKSKNAVPVKSAVRLLLSDPKNDDDVITMLAETGRAVVNQRLVDSHFGNISYVHNGHIFISQTGSSLDELEGCIDKVPLDGSSSIGITASSELSAHKNIYLRTGHNAILHGHPKFSVIMSMYCKKEGCDRSVCHKACKEARSVMGTPVVPGEIGTGPAGLMHTVPPAISDRNGVIVYGHGVFTAGNDNFQGPFDMLNSIEDSSRSAYFNAVNGLLKHLCNRDFDCI